jgi:glucose/arabinose dehydrogenase
MNRQGIALVGKIVTDLAALLVLFPTLLFYNTAFALSTERIAAGLSRPLFATAPPGDTIRLFVLEQYTAQIKILKGGVALASPFLDINNLVSDSGSERGLLGLVFHPSYETNGYFYVNYTNNAGDTVVARYSASENPDVANPNSALILITISQPYSNHNGGTLAFGPNDGYLYIGMGDGGSAGDPENRAQNDGELLGKMLRIDVDNENPYAIPPDNPYVGSGDPREEIWAKGLRNPWRFSFDRLTGDLYIADVGQNSYEEIDFQPALSAGGENYGWRLMEGNYCYNPPINCDPGGLTYPIHEYSHGGNPFRCSVTGGYVYRGSDIADLYGTYFFADFCSDQVWSFRYDGSNLTSFTDRTAELNPGNGVSIDSISSFGEDGNGELYLVDLGGEIFKLCPPAGCISLCKGNFDCDEDVDGSDASLFKNDFGRSTISNPCTNQLPCRGDFNCDQDADGSDASIFKSDFGRSTFNNPCPPCPAAPWCSYP